jgi:serine/threonine protein kinase
MKPERWKQIEQLYHAALDREPDERAAFLAETCIDDSGLRREVEELLGYDGAAGSFIQGNALAFEARRLEPEDLSQTAPQLLPGQHIGAYKILALLGRGGMGVVYRAHDKRLRRDVAIKLLPPEFTADRGRVRRFAQEARAASALNHPNIITIHEIGEASAEGGVAHYIVTEYVEGETLRRRMAGAPRRRIEAPEAIEIALQVAAALSSAHQRGITHRDIKPENVMVRRDGIVKVLDFGLAKLTETPDPTPTSGVDTQAPTLVSAAKTDSGALMGTARYMSPEQARGEKVDARSDVFSLGVMLYELVAGRAPFVGATTSEVIAAILRDDPPPLTSHTPEAPRGLGKIVSRTLCKAPEGRYQTANDLLHDLNLLKQEMRIGILGLQIADSSNHDARAKSPNARPKTSSLSTRNRAALVVLLIAAIAAIIPSSLRTFNERLHGGHSVESPSPAPQDKLFPRLMENLGSGVVLEMAQLPGGEYEIGSNLGEGEEDESPKHKVKVDSFALGVYEVTQGQWKAVMGSGDNPSHFSGNDNLPVDNVSWALAQDFIKALQQKTGQQGYRLPTEKEWEYAARAGSNGKWGFDDGKGELSYYAWYSKNAANRTQPVGKKNPNKWGLFDMQGNVMELCQDWYDEDAYKPGRRNPAPRKYHVLRGGCIVCAESDCRVSFRDYDESGPGKYIGFRIAMTLKSSDEVKSSITAEPERVR